jgi:hypothetical protein
MILIVTLGLTVIITVALIYGSRRWESATKEMHAKLEAARLPVVRKTYSPDELIALPAPVQNTFGRYLRTDNPSSPSSMLESEEPKGLDRLVSIDCCHALRTT